MKRTDPTLFFHSVAAMVAIAVLSPTTARADFLDDDRVRRVPAPRALPNAVDGHSSQAVGMWGFVCPQCTGHLAFDQESNSVVVSMSTTAAVAARFDSSTFMLRLVGSDEVTTIDLSSADPEIDDGDASYTWNLADAELPVRAMLSVWGTDGARYDLELELSTM